MVPPIKHRLGVVPADHMRAFSLRCAVLAASASDGPRRSAVSSWLIVRSALRNQPTRHLRALEILVTIVDALRRATRRRQFSNPIPIPTNIHRIVGCCEGSAKLM